ncbi:unnamed protein product [Fraxinus pennsylvanica]|uniref:Uncharacterized protein n=1 Tax=Fraxinus pennsylvanica TaxID=56036 RepID=A0AAD1YXZ8_9LAMI|nr:unnamed protein product [Fraxinus pennsylvanica]
MKLVWSPETASKAYLDTVKSCELHKESGVAELISAMAAGWKAKLIVETWSQGGAIATSVGLSIASRHGGGRHICIAPDEESRVEYAAAMEKAGGTTSGESFGRRNLARGVLCSYARMQIQERHRILGGEVS